MYVLKVWVLDVYLSVSGHILFVSARIPVHICTYPSPYLHVSQFVSARIPVRICTYPGSYLRVSYSVSECIPVLICTYPVCIWTYPGLYLLVPCLCLHLQFNAHLAKHRPRRPGQASQISTHTHTHTHKQTNNHSRTHLHCAAFFLRLRVRAGALSAQRRQPPVSEWQQDCACRFADSPRSVAYLRRVRRVFALEVHKIKPPIHNTIALGQSKIAV